MLAMLRSCAEADRSNASAMAAYSRRTRGSAARSDIRTSDPTRRPALYDGVAEYLLRCGAGALAEAGVAAVPADDGAACLQPELL